MNVVAWIIGVVLAGGSALVGGAKLADLDRTRERLGYELREYRMIGAAEVVAAIAIIVGLVWRSLEWIAIAAGFGLTVVAMGALMAHARASDDGSRIVPAGVLFVVSVLFIIFIAVR